MQIDYDLRLDRQLAAAMPRAWPAFFSVFGRLTAVQRAAIPKIMAGHDILLCSATASGKTEAVCAPLVERNIDRHANWKILYVTPTRALVNDLYERLVDPLKSLGLHVARRTGDHRDMSCDRAHIILTTPESFDSLLCRGKQAKGHILASTVAVVLDEIHLLYGSARGEQVRWLLHRLSRLKKQALQRQWCRSQRVQVIGLSATINQPELVCDAFIPGGEVIVVDGKRDIECIKPPEIPIGLVEALLSHISSLPKREKILVFCNTRRRVDELAYHMRDELNEYGYEILAHHGSLSRHIREQAEETARQADAVVIFATSTLELGIDIGDIDLVALDSPAPNVSDLLQRIGRGNRRSNKTRVLFCARNNQDALINTAMLEAARNGFLGEHVPGPNYGVARQQVVSYLFQAPNGYRSFDKVQGLIEECMPDGRLNGLLETLVAEGELVQDHGKLRLGRYWLDRMGTGVIHTNIEDTGGYRVVDEITGKMIASGVEYRGGKGIKTAGKKLRVHGVEGNRIMVMKDNKPQEEANWRYVGRYSMTGNNQAVALRYYLNIPEEVWPVLHINDETHVFHFGGRQRALIIDMLARKGGVNTNHNMLSSNEFFITFKGIVTEKPHWLTACSAASLHEDIAQRLDSLENRLGRPLANRKLPLRARIEEVKGWLGVEREVTCISNSQWFNEYPDEIEGYLLGILEV